MKIVNFTVVFSTIRKLVIMLTSVYFHMRTQKCADMEQCVNATIAYLSMIKIKMKVLRVKKKKRKKI